MEKKNETKDEKRNIYAASFLILNSNSAWFCRKMLKKKKISASVDNGVLNIELPKITQEEKKQANRVIEIK